MTGGVLSACPCVLPSGQQWARAGKLGAAASACLFTPPQAQGAGDRLAAMASMRR